MCLELSLTELFIGGSKTIWRNYPIATPIQLMFASNFIYNKLQMQKRLFIY